MLIYLFDIRGTIHFEFVPKETIVDHAFYVEVLKRLFDAVRRKRGELWRDRALILHHYNAPEYSSLRVSQILAGKGISAMDHPPYSPDLAPADFLLFPKLKECFSKVEDTKSSAKEILTDIPVQDFKNSFNNGRSSENTVKNWREISLKNSRLPISAALKVKVSKDIPVTGHGSPHGCKRLRLPHYLDKRLIGGGKVVSSTRRPHFTPRFLHF
jgi:histone-lysine N-methyltransferase SETMAR